MSIKNDLRAVRDAWNLWFTIAALCFAYVIIRIVVFGVRPW